MDDENDSLNHQTNSDTHGEMHKDDTSSSYEEENDVDNDNRTCGICPRTLSGKLIGNEEGCSVDFHLNPCTMSLSVLIIWSFVIWCAIDENAAESIGNLQRWIVYYCTWFYVGSMICFGGFITYLLFSKYGDIKLGPEDEEPRFSMCSWFAMLFSAGVGVGLYFFGVGEPVWHYYDAKNGNNRYYNASDNLQRGLDAMNLSWFHWGLTASAVYCVVGLPLAYCTHVKNAPLKFSAAFIPLLGKKYANGFVGDCIDTFAVVGTMFGVATSLGLGVIQLNGMLHYMMPNKVDAESTDLRIIIIWIITGFATMSVFTGLDVGIRRLSEGNFAFCLILLFYLFFICDPFYILNLFIQTIGYHINHLFELTFMTDAFQQVGFTGESSNASSTNYQSFMQWWTVFYWGWWIAWSPFVGIFIAQISRGRTIRQFILGNMFVPTLFTSLWLTVFGGVGLYHELAFDNINGNYGASSNSVCTDELMHSTYKGSNVVYLECYITHLGFETMLFAMIDAYPLGTLMNIFAAIGLVTYFVTSSDSASHVIDVLTANGNEEPPKIQRIFWSFGEGAVASVLLAVGGSEALTALQTVSIAAGLPFCAILLVLCYSFWYTLKTDFNKKKLRNELTDSDTRIISNQPRHWEFDLLDSTNPQLTNPSIIKNWFYALLCPCFAQWNNYMKMCSKDSKSKVFGLSNDAQGTFWSILIFSTSLMALIFAILGIFINGCTILGLIFYIFFVAVNAWQRMRIRNYFGITGDQSGILCDVLAHLCCAYPWTIVQEKLQCDSTKVCAYNHDHHVDNFGMACTATATPRRRAAATPKSLVTPRSTNTSRILDHEALVGGNQDDSELDVDLLANTSAWK